MSCLRGTLYSSRHAKSAFDVGPTGYQAEFEADNKHIIASFNAWMLADLLLAYAETGQAMLANFTDFRPALSDADWLTDLHHLTISTPDQPAPSSDC